MHMCARVSVLKCWVCLAPVRTLPRRPAWCPWPPGSADPALESRWALLFFPQFLGKGFKVLKLKLGSKTQRWKVLETLSWPHNGSSMREPRDHWVCWETHCQHSCVKTLPTAQDPPSSHRPLPAEPSSGGRGAPHPVQGQDCSPFSWSGLAESLGLGAFNTGAPDQDLDKASFGPPAPSRT